MYIALLCSEIGEILNIITWCNALLENIAKYHVTDIGMWRYWYEAAKVWKPYDQSKLSKTNGVIKIGKFAPNLLSRSERQTLPEKSSLKWVP